MPHPQHRIQSWSVVKTWPRKLCQVICVFFKTVGGSCLRCSCVCAARSESRAGPGGDSTAELGVRSSGAGMYLLWPRCPVSEDRQAHRGQDASPRALHSCPRGVSGPERGVFPEKYKRYLPERAHDCGCVREKGVRQSTVLVSAVGTHRDRTLRIVGVSPFSLVRPKADVQVTFERLPCCLVSSGCSGSHPASPGQHGRLSPNVNPKIQKGLCQRPGEALMGGGDPQSREPRRCFWETLVGPPLVRPPMGSSVECSGAACPRP